MEGDVDVASTLNQGHTHNLSQDVITAWRRHLTRHPPGHPDGAGLRGSLLSLASDAFPYIALRGWFRYNPNRLPDHSLQSALMFGILLALLAWAYFHRRQIYRAIRY